MQIRDSQEVLSFALILPILFFLIGACIWSRQARRKQLDSIAIKVLPIEDNTQQQQQQSTHKEIREPLSEARSSAAAVHIQESCLQEAPQELQRNSLKDLHARLRARRLAEDASEGSLAYPPPLAKCLSQGLSQEIAGFDEMPPPLASMPSAGPRVYRSLSIRTSSIDQQDVGALLSSIRSRRRALDEKRASRPFGSGSKSGSTRIHMSGPQTQVFPASTSPSHLIDHGPSSNEIVHSTSDSQLVAQSSYLTMSPENSSQFSAGGSMVRSPLSGAPMRTPGSSRYSRISLSGVPEIALMNQK